MGPCPTCGAQVESLEAASRTHSYSGNGMVEALMRAEPCGHEITARYRDDRFAPLYDVELVEP